MRGKLAARANPRFAVIPHLCQEEKLTVGKKEKDQWKQLERHEQNAAKWWGEGVG